ncbi:DUF7373 family lipoprotein, partial [Mycolicibacterium insubricum]
MGLPGDSDRQNEHPGRAGVHRARPVPAGPDRPKRAPAASAELVAAILDRQGPLIDTFAPTPFDQLAALPVDPTGLWA